MVFSSGYELKRVGWRGQKGDITVAVADDESLSLQVQEDLQPIAEAALKVMENLRATILEEERRR